MNITILPDLPEGESNFHPDRLAAIQQDLDHMYYEHGIDAPITAAQLAALEDRGFIYDFTTGQLRLNGELINLN